MTEILRRKLLKLVHGEEGVALVVTLALFMFLYVSCAGVYAVGRAVKDRIILQNAVDAAAYSAAVVQADYLSRIATINKAMAWNYVQFIKGQKNWISLSFLDAVYRETWAFNTPIEIVAGSKVTSQSKESLMAFIAGKSAGDYESEIERYHSRLERQKAELAILRGKMIRDVSSAAEDVLQANLPWRLGELCRFKVKVEDALQAMSGEEEENRFIEISGQDTGSNPTWYEFSGSGGFGRDVLSAGKLVALSWQRSNDNIVWSSAPIVDAFLRYIPQSVPRYGYEIQPLKLADGRFFPEGPDAKGAITVAVAKWNENPWKGLVSDLTRIHAVFTHTEKNDWTFAIASAQAGYRNNTDTEAREEGRAYSLNGNDFDVVKLGKTVDDDEYNGQDWDALYLPVRKAFANGDKFKDWLTENSGDNEWKELVDAGNRKYVTKPLEEIHFDELNHKALSRMHNNGGTDQILKWNGDGVHEFLDLMYH